MDGQPQYWVHDLNPFAIHFWGDYGIRWYGLAYVAGMVFGGLLMLRWVRQLRAPLRAKEIQDFVLVTGLSMIICGRIGYCLFYASDLLIRDPLYLLRVNEGGMSSHGGIIGIFIGVAIYAWRNKRPLLVLADMMCAAAPIGVIFGRIANFVNGELWGRHIQSRVPWAVIFPTELNPPRDVPSDQVHAWQQAHWFLAQPRHPSQLYAAVLEGLLPLLLILPIHARHRKPGLTMGVLLMFYSTGRFIDEFFREPDFGQPIFFGWMSKGQLLTIPLLLVGVGIAAWAARRPSRPGLYVVPT